MSRRKIGGLVLCAAVVVGGACFTVRSQEKAAEKTSAKAREDFIKSFRRTGLATTPEDAMMLRILVEARGAKRGIEVGTEQGFGAINMGIGFERTGGKLFTIEISEKTAEIARKNIAAVGLEKTVTVIQGDALKKLPTLEGEFDFIFIDALKRDYFKYFKLVEKKLKPGAVIVGDNAIRSAGAMKDFLDYLKESPDYEMVVIRASEQKHDGMVIAYKIR